MNLWLSKLYKPKEWIGEYKFRFKKIQSLLAKKNHCDEFSQGVSTAYRFYLNAVKNSLKVTIYICVQTFVIL